MGLYYSGSHGSYPVYLITRTAHLIDGIRERAYPHRSSRKMLRGSSISNSCGQDIIQGSFATNHW